MADDRLRELERSFAAGDGSVAPELKQARIRAGVCWNCGADRDGPFRLCRVCWAKMIRASRGQRPQVDLDAPIWPPDPDCTRCAGTGEHVLGGPGATATELETLEMVRERGGVAQGHVVRVRCACTNRPSKLEGPS